MSVEMIDWGSVLNELFKTISNVRGALLPLGLALLICGFLMAFFGKDIFNALLFFAGGFLVGGGILLLFSLRGGITLSSIAFAIVGFVGGGVLIYFVFYSLIFLVGSSIGGVVGLLIFQRARAPTN